LPAILLTESGSIFVQIGDEKCSPRFRALLDEVFGEDNFVAIIPFRKKTMALWIEVLSNKWPTSFYGMRRLKTDSKGARQCQIPKAIFPALCLRASFHHCWYEDVEGLRTRMSKHQLYNHALLTRRKSRVYRLKSLEPSGADGFRNVLTMKFRG